MGIIRPSYNQRDVISYPNSHELIFPIFRMIRIGFEHLFSKQGTRGHLTTFSTSPSTSASNGVKGVITPK